GKYILPLKSGWLISDDPEFNDNFDFPQKSDEYAEPWIAKENQLGFGCGLIWDSSQVDSIRGNPFSGPQIDTKTYTLQPGETIKLGHFTWVFGRSIAHLTHIIWLNEFNGKEFSSVDDSTIEYCISPLEIRCGQDLSIPGVTSNPLPSLNWIDVDSNNIPMDILYYARRETPIEVKLDLESSLWKSPFQWNVKLESGINNQIQIEIPKDKHLDPQTLQIFTFKGEIHLPYTSRPFSGAVIPYKSSRKVTLEKKEDEWLFSNNLMSFQSSPTHGASLYSGRFNDGENLFFSRFPTRESFVWFKRFVGGFHPFVKISYHWDWFEFLDNVWSDPILIEKDKWFGLSYQLNSPDNDFRLKNVACKITYYTRSESPLLWGQLSFTNNSGVTASIDAGFFLFLKPIQELITKRHNKIWTYSKTEKERTLHTMPPDNWAIASFGDNKEKVLMVSPEPKITLRGDYMNANNYCELLCFNSYKLAPKKARSINVGLLFSNTGTIEDFQAIFSQGREVIQK
ncbi:MAG: hypothetical protein ACFFDT_38970, partial [Candidatus Hodarchaeota archaeon]